MYKSIIATMLLATLGYFSAEAQTTKKNILFIAVDDLRPELGAMDRILPSAPIWTSWQVKVCYLTMPIASKLFADHRVQVL